MLKALQWHTGDQLNIAGQAEGTSTPSKVTVAFQLSPMKSADALKGWRTEFALVCLSNPIPSRCPDRNSISWQDMCVMYQPANLLTQQGDARGVPETSFTPPLCDLYLQPIGPNAFKVSRSWSLFTEKSGRFVTLFCSLWHDWAAVEHEYNMLESKFKGRYSGTVNAHMVSFKFYKSSLWIVLFVEQHLTYISHRACMLLSAIGLKPYYFNTQSCVICAMHVGEVVKCRTETSEMEKKNPLRFSHYSVSNLGSPLSFIMCINPLSCGVGAGAQGRRGAVTDSVRFFKKGNCITLIEEPLSALKASAFSAQATFTHQYFLCCFTTVFLALITCSP